VSALAATRDDNEPITHPGCWETDFLSLAKARNSLWGAGEDAVDYVAIDANFINKHMLALFGSGRLKEKRLHDCGIQSRNDTARFQLQFIAESPPLSV